MAGRVVVGIPELAETVRRFMRDNYPHAWPPVRIEIVLPKDERIILPLTGVAPARLPPQAKEP